MPANPLGGTSFAQFNIEIGRSLGAVLRVVAFVDVGNVYSSDNDNDFDIGSLRRSARSRPPHRDANRADSPRLRL